MNYEHINLTARQLLAAGALKRRGNVMRYKPAMRTEVITRAILLAIVSLVVAIALYNGGQ